MNNDQDSYATRIVDDLPYAVRVVPQLPVRLHDGTTISLKLWLPVLADGMRLPVVLEAIPYRKDDNSLVDDEARHGYVAGHGYVCIRMDLRGSGSSTGALEDEYSPEEQSDIAEIVDWASRQPFSNGRVGMTGISWSGFNSLQVAAKRPPALRAIISVCSTDDRYDNDVHYMGGSLLAFYQNLWGTAMHMQNLTPPDPHHAGPGWRDEWIHRLHHNVDYTALWTQHQRRDAYWRQGSVREEYDALAVPALLVGGWADPYTDAIFRLLHALGPQSRGLIGPWAHTWPERPVPGPAIGFLQECVRWWDAWLKDADNGVRDDPRLRFYLQDGEAFSTEVRHRSGRWLETDSLEGLDETWGLEAPGGLVRGRIGEGTVVHSSPLLLGKDARHFEPMGGLGDIPAEQTTDDADSAVFESDPLSADLAIFGAPVVRLRVRVDRPDAFVFARLTDVDTDGRSYLITRGSLNLAHRDGHDTEVAPVPVDSWTDVEIPLKHVAERLPAGHRLRIALSTSYWPWIWPSPERATITIDAAGSSLVVPRIDPEAQTPLRRAFGPPEIARPPVVDSVSDADPTWEWAMDESSGVQRIEKTTPRTVKTYPHGLVTTSSGTTSWVLQQDDPLSATMAVSRSSAFERDDWRVAVHLQSTMSCTRDAFVVRTRVTAEDENGFVYGQDRTTEVPRDHN
jgi:uncharacterized protein